MYLISEAFSESDLPMRVDLLDIHSVSPAFKEIILKNSVDIFG